MYGVAIIVIMLLAPEGLFWTVRDRLSSQAAPPAPLRRCRSPPAAAAAPAAAPRRGRRCWKCADCRARSAACARSTRSSFTVAARRDLRHHRPERRRQDDAVQRAERRARRRRRAQRRFAGQPMVGRKLHQVCAHGHRPHLPGGAQLPAPAGARQRGGRRVRRRTVRRGGRRAPRRTALRPRRAGAAQADIAGRPAHQQGAAADGAGARAGRRGRACCCSTRRSPASAARSATTCSPCCSGCAREGMTIVIIEHTMHAMVRLADSFAGARPRPRARQRRAARGGRESRAVIEAYLGKKWLATDARRSRSLGRLWRLARAHGSIARRSPRASSSPSSARTAPARPPVQDDLRRRAGRRRARSASTARPAR